MKEQKIGRMQMSNEFCWIYTMGKQNLALFVAGSDERVGTLSVQRDQDGRIVAGKVFTYNPSLINRVDFFDKVNSVPGLDKRDISDVFKIKDGFFRLEGYVRDRESFCIYAYEPDPEKRAELLRKATLARIGLGMRFGDFVDGFVEKVISGEIEGE